MLLLHQLLCQLTVVHRCDTPKVGFFCNWWISNSTRTSQPDPTTTESKICWEITTWTEHRQGFCWNRWPAEILDRRWNRQRCAMCFVGSWDPGLCFFGCCNAGFVENAKTWCLSEWEIQRRWQIRKAELDKKQVNWKQDQHNNEHFNAFRILPSGDLEFQCTGRIELTISMLSQETYQVAKVNGTSFNKNLPVPLRWKNSFSAICFKVQGASINMLADPLISVRLQFAWQRLRDQLQ